MTKRNTMIGAFCFDILSTLAASLAKADKEKRVIELTEDMTMGLDGKFDGGLQYRIRIFPPNDPLGKSPMITVPYESHAFRAIKEASTIVATPEPPNVQPQPQ